MENETKTLAEKMYKRHGDVWAGLNTIHELFPVINMMQASLDSDKPMDKHQIISVLDACKTILLYGGGLIEDWLFIAEEK